MTEQYGGIAYDSVDELLMDDQIQAVSVCAANAYHAEITINALKQGKHVLCEKPMAISLEQCETMVNTAKEMGKRLMIGHNQRLLRTHQSAKALIESEILGKAISFSTVFGHKGPERWSIDKGNNTWFYKKNLASFGSMADLGIHKVDLIRYLLGGQVESVYAILTTLDKKLADGQPIEVDDNSIELLKFRDGPIGTITTSWTHYGKECNTTVIYCQKGSIHLYEDPKYSMVVIHDDGRIERYELDAIPTNEDDIQLNSGVIDTFIQGLLSGEKTTIEGEEVLESMKVVFACLDSASTGCSVKVK
jgi:predicted dehydrogenase